MTMSREDMMNSLKVALMMADDDPEICKLLDKVASLKHEYRDGHLLVGSGAPRWEVRRAKSGNVYCKCPAYAFKDRAGKGSGLCKHMVYALALGLEIPSTEDLKIGVAIKF